MSSKRFDYVRYDEISLEQQMRAKDLCLELEAFITDISSGRSASIALTALEEVYMWIGKAIRDEQVNYRGAKLQEERNDE